MTSDRVEEIAGRYQLLERLGSGGMGTVWRATDRLLERPVAVKEVNVHGGGGALSQRLHRAHREGRAIARVSHPNVINIHDLVIHDDRLWLVMELVQGPSLAEHVAAHGPLSVQRVAEIGLELLSALDAVHAVGILHRDVKPANVLLRPDGRVVLCDFGIVALEDTLALTTAGGVLGTVDYLPPERLEGKKAEPPSDLFSLGGLLCALFTGRSPFARAEPAAAIYAVVSEPPLLPEAAGPLRPVLAALLAKDPAARPSSDEIAAALRPLAAVSGPTGPPLAPRVAEVPRGVFGPPVPPEGPRVAAEVPHRRNDRRRLRVRNWSVVLAALVIIGGGGWLLADRWSGPPPASADDKPSVQPTRSEPAQDDASGSDPAPTESTEIDAALAHSGGSPLVWLFSGDRYMRVRMSESDTGDLVMAREVGPSPVEGNWSDTLEKVPGFDDHVDAVFPVPGSPGEHWVFSGKEYIRVHVANGDDDPDTADYDDTLVSGPAPLSDWSEAFCQESDFLEGVDAVMPAPDDPREVWVFAGSDYIRMRLADEGPGGTCAVERKPLTNWGGSLKKYPNFSKGIDASVTVPGSKDEVWVFSGTEYLRVRLGGYNYADDTSVGEPKKLPDWTTLP